MQRRWTEASAFVATTGLVRQDAAPAGQAVARDVPTAPTGTGGPTGQGQLVITYSFAYRVSVDHRGRRTFEGDAMAGSDIGSDTIKVRRVSSWRANWSASGSGQPGTNIFQLVLDDGAAEAVLALTTDDADNLFDWLSASNDVHYDVEREVLMFGPHSTS